MQQGDIGNDFYLIEDGECKVTIADGEESKDMGVLKSADFFGTTRCPV